MSHADTRLVIIAGKRKAGTTMLFAALGAAWKPGVKDRDWRGFTDQCRAFLASGAASGVIAKADAIHEPDRLLAALSEARVPREIVRIVLVDRDPRERFLSFVAHARKLGRMRIASARAAFAAEERATRDGIAALVAAGLSPLRLSYEALAAGEVTEVAGLALTRPDHRRNARGEVLLFFALLRRLVETRAYARLRDTRPVSGLRALYYRHLAAQSPRRNGALHLVVLGSVAGPVDGQRRITRLFCEGTTCRVSLFDFDEHRRWWGPARIALQWLRALWIAARGGPDAVYIALSRSRAGLIRDALLLAPLTGRGVRVVAHVHGADFAPFYLEDRRMRALKRRQLARIDRFLFLDPALLPAAPALAGRCMALANPLPGFAARALAAPPPAPRHPPVLGFISAFLPGKGLEAFLALADALGPAARFRVAGGAHPAAPAYGAAMQAELRARPAIEHMGYLDDPTAFYEGTDILVFPTRYAAEALPGVVLEALAFGCLPLLRPVNALAEVFAEAPVRWARDDAALEGAARALIACPKALRSERAAAKAWARRHLPERAAWIDAIERQLIPAPQAPA